MRWYHILKTIIGRWIYNKAMPLNIRKSGNLNILERYIRIDIKVSDFMNYIYHLHPNNMAWREECFFAGGEIEAWCEINCNGAWAYLPEIEKDIYSFYFLDQNDAAFFKMVWR